MYAIILQNTTKRQGENMNLIDMLVGKDNSVGERIDYIFSKFQENFHEVKYKERESIIGIDESGIL